MNKPLDGMNLPDKAGERVIDKPELPDEGIDTDSTVYTEMYQGSLQLKRGTVRHFEVFCDEGEHIGGTDKYPSPMSYMAMGTGF